MQPKNKNYFLGWNRGIILEAKEGKWTFAKVRKEKIFFDGGKNMKRALVILVFLLLATPLWAAEV